MLPAAEMRNEVVAMVKENQIVIVSGETGCGKTTQIPQYLLDDPDLGPGCNMAVTQPRRLSAVSVAERIAAERSQKVGGTIGYNIRFERMKGRNTQVGEMGGGGRGGAKGIDQIGVPSWPFNLSHGVVRVFTAAERCIEQ